MALFGVHLSKVVIIPGAQNACAQFEAWRSLAFAIYDRQRSTQSQDGPEEINLIRSLASFPEIVHTEYVVTIEHSLKITVTVIVTQQLQMA